MEHGAQLCPKGFRNLEELVASQSYEQIDASTRLWARGFMVGVLGGDYERLTVFSAEPGIFFGKSPKQPRLTL